MGNVVHSTYTTGTRALPDIYARALGPAALGLVRYIRQSTRACGISITYNYLKFADSPRPMRNEVKHQSI